MAEYNRLPTPMPGKDIDGQSSTFDGTTLQLIGWRLLGILLSIMTLGIASPWATCMVYRWQAKHTLVEGQRLHFNGKGHQLLVRYLLWGLLILVTFGIYAIFLPVRMRKWHAEHLSFATGNEQEQPQGVLIALIAAAVVGGIAITALAVSLLPKYLNADIFDKLTDRNPPSTTEATVYQPPVVIPEVTTPPASVWYVNVATGLRVRTEPNTDATVIEMLKKGTQVNVEYWDGPWAYIGYGWVYGDYLVKENPNPPTQPSGNNSQSGNTSQSGSQGGNNSEDLWETYANFLVGAWSHAYYDADTNRLNMGTYYTFNSDGTFSGNYSNRAYYYDPAQGWVYDYAMGAGGQSFGGTYRYNGSTLELTYTYLEWSDTVPAPESFSASVQGSVLYIDSRPYYPWSVDQIGSLLCPNPPVTEEPTLPPDAVVLDPAIFGTWTYALYDQSAGRLLTQGYYSFAGDGTFSGAYGDKSYIYSTTEGWIYDYSAGSGSERFSGTYRYQNGILELTFNYMEWSSIPAPTTYYASIDGGVLYLNSTPYYPGTTNEIGNLLCPDPISGEAAMLDSAIFGTWYEFLRNADGDQLLYPVSYTFNSDGTFSRSTQDSYFTYSPETGLTNMGSGSETGYGTYTYHDGVLAFGTQKINVTISGDILYMYDDVLYRTDDIWAYARESLTPQ